MKKSIKILISVLASIIGVVAVVLVVAFLVVPSVKYNDALKFIENGDYEQAITKLTEAGSFKDAEEQLLESKYLLAADYQAAEEYGKAAILYGSIKDYKDSREKSLAMWDKTGAIKTVSVVDSYTWGAAVKNDGTVVVSADAPDWTEDVKSWIDIHSVYSKRGCIIGVKKDGTIIGSASDTETKQLINNCGWTDIVKVVTVNDHIWEINHLLGLKSDGTVVVLHMNKELICSYKDLENMTDVIDIHTSYDGSYVVLKADGTVVSEGTGDYGELNVADWTDIVAIVYGDNHTVGIKKDGTVVATGNNQYGQCNLNDWTNIKRVAVNDYCTIGVKEDGTAVCVGVESSSVYSTSGYNTREWTDIADAFISYDRFAVGLREDGTVIFDSYSSKLLSMDIYDMKKWNNIRIPE